MYSGLAALCLGVHNSRTLDQTPHLQCGQLLFLGTAQEDGQQFAWPCFLLKVGNRDKRWLDSHELICPKIFPGGI